MTFLPGSLTDLEENWNAKGSNILLQKFNDDYRNARGKMDRGSYGNNMHKVSVLSKKTWCLHFSYYPTIQVGW